MKKLIPILLTVSVSSQASAFINYYLIDDVVRITSTRIVSGTQEISYGDAQRLLASERSKRDGRSETQKQSDEEKKKSDAQRAGENKDSVNKSSENVLRNIMDSAKGLLTRIDKIINVLENLSNFEFHTGRTTNKVYEFYPDGSDIVINQIVFQKNALDP